VTAVRRAISGKDWDFRNGDWRDCLNNLKREDFVYLDPPYIGRHTDYFNQWSESDASDLVKITQSLPCGFALSMWKENQYRTNDYLDLWKEVDERTVKHFYHVGSMETLRHEMEEVLLIRQGYTAPEAERMPDFQLEQPNLFI
jgi:DNA adenine methylase